MKIVNELLSNEIDYLNALRNAQEMPQPKENVITKREQISDMAKQAVSKMKTTQTAVDLIVQNLPQIDWDDPFYVGLYQEANNIFKEQIKDAYWNGTMHITKAEALSYAENFYNEYYNKPQ